METETIDRLFLELSQVTKARTEREVRLENALTPRLWTKHQHDAWHKALPDTVAAFKALLDAA